MTHTLLRSGCPNDFIPIGYHGHRVFDFAQQIRETLRIRNYQAVSDMLAIPQLNEQADRVDWYAPQGGRTRQWSALTAPQRSHALSDLEQGMQHIEFLGEQCLHTGHKTWQLFGALLLKSLYVPGSQFIYLVEDKPVITFWGFTYATPDPAPDVLALLRERAGGAGALSLGVIPPCPADDSGLAREAKNREGAQGSSPEGYHFPASLAGQLTAPSPSGNISPGGMGLIRRAILSLAGLALALYVPHPLVSPTPFLLPSDNKLHVAQASPVQPVILPMPLPLLKAAFITAPPPPEVEIAQPAPAMPRRERQRLTIPAREVKQGSTAFLNGHWQIKGHIAPETEAHYAIASNKGKVSFFDQQHGECQANLLCGLLPSGRLKLKHPAPARCADGYLLPLPDIFCKPGENRQAICKAIVAEKRWAAVSVEKVSDE